MTDPLALRAEAAAATATASRCEELAAEIERMRLLLATRIEPVRGVHRPEVWQSRAADESRAMLNRYVAPGLWFLGDELARTVRLLRERADLLLERSTSLVSAAAELEATTGASTTVLLS